MFSKNNLIRGALFAASGVLAVAAIGYFLTLDSGLFSGMGFLLPIIPGTFILQSIPHNLVGGTYQYVTVAGFISLVVWCAAGVLTSYLIDLLRLKK